MPRRAARRAGHHLVPRSYASTSSAYASTVAAQADSEDEANKRSIASLTLDVPLIPLKTKAQRVPLNPFPFLSLPSELRVKVYEHYFDGTDKVLDLDPDNHRRIHKILGLMRVCKQIHAEAAHLFYSTRPFRIFPTHHAKKKKPLLARLKPGQREYITSLELRLGPGWNSPPKTWVVNDALGLKDCVNVRKLNVFVECDPSDGVFKGFRRSEGFYEGFSRRLLASVIDELPAVGVIEFDAWSSVKKSGDMMRGLLDVATQSKRLIRWGPERGWTDTDEDTTSADSAARFVNSIPIQGYASNILVVA
ncbi:Uncharacterized protein TCAP_05809 [Tolypocladium capitatum]|uniref:Uncharacterized protein n=1 Tax=Tolypocladium capitatum TaxID=45235 RepID=A0A2K3Q9U1_9HYPO|nr:Uncharacterized protein TCAP_05809 [Tolypocladium capitatum]